MNTKPSKPAIGTPVSRCIGSDSYADSVANVSESGFILDTENGARYTWRPSVGRYVAIGATNKGPYLSIGTAIDYRDPQF